MKTCRKCGETKPTTEFHKAARNRDGVRNECKTCSNKAQAARYVNDPDKHKANSAKWHAANPEKAKAKSAKWHAANTEKAKASAAAWYAANSDKAKERTAKSVALNPEKKKAYNAAWRAANPEKHKAAKAAWAKANAESCRIRNHNRRARKRANGGVLSKGLADKLFNLQRGKCACGCKQPLGDDYHLDHIMPIALGGTNTDSNIQLLRAKCNIQKYAKHPVDFMQQRGFLL